MITCRQCHQNNKDAYKFCIRCGETLGSSGTLDRRRLGSEEIRAVDFHRCVKCGDESPIDFEFCGTCGSGLTSKSRNPTVDAGSPGPNTFSGPPATLVVIHPDGSEGERFHMVDDGYVGRSVTPMFSDDSFLSPRHFLLKKASPNTVVIQDNNSLNGTFLRIEGSEILADQSVFRVGQELLLFERIRDVSATSEGVLVQGATNPGYWAKVSLILPKGRIGASFPLLYNEVSFGRENGDIVFFDDGYVSGTHAIICRNSDGEAILKDGGSLNGTFIRNNMSREISYGSLILVGQQLIRIDRPLAAER